MAMRRTYSLLLLASLVLLAACSAESGILRTPGGPETQVRIFVRDRATQSPVADAAVALETASRDHAFSAASILGQTGPESAQGRTDAEGAITLSTLHGREFRVVVWAAGRAPVIFTPAAINASEGAWIDPELPPQQADPGVEVRVEEGSGRK
jgi:hypothetical protein